MIVCCPGWIGTCRHWRNVLRIICVSSWNSNPTSTTDSHLIRIRITNCIHTVVPPDDGPRYARNMYRLAKCAKNNLRIKLVFLYTIIRLVKKLAVFFLWNSNIWRRVHNIPATGFWRGQYEIRPTPFWRSNIHFCISSHLPSGLLEVSFLEVFLQNRVYICHHCHACHELRAHKFPGWDNVTILGLFYLQVWAR